MNKKIKAILICFLIAFSYLLLFVGIGKLLKPIVELSDNLYLVQAIRYMIMSIFLIGILYFINKLNILKFQFGSFFKGIKVGMFFLIIGIINLVTGLYGGITGENELLPIIQIVFFVVAILIGTGFTEEVLCRGIIQNILYDAYGKNDKVGIVSSIIITSVIFGSAHIINAFSANIDSVLAQMIGACAIGLCFGAIYARCNNIWATIFLHGFIDFSILIKSGFWGENDITSIINTYDLKYTLIQFIIYTLVFLYLMRKNKIRECFNN